ncbi:MAG: hypothetical protein M3Z85_10445 [Acidobacteriota bacterium]|nr:hypothetical protein [Acidobacteriota bacterium]
MNLWRRLPAILSFALLALQAGIPWTARHFVTQDGPSHLYTAIVAKDLLLHPDSRCAAVYKFQPELVPNWTTTVLLAGAASIAGADRAEQLLATLSILAGFFSIAYACRALDPAAPPWSPVINFLLHTWFLWIGFYNFYLGMVLCPLVLGFYVRNVRSFTIRRASILSAGLVLLFFTHLIPAALTIAALIFVALWVHLQTPRHAAKTLGLFAASLVPAMALFALYLDASIADIPFKPDLASAWKSFPMHVFATPAGLVVRQELLYPAVLFYIVMAAMVMRRREWLSARTGVLLAALTALTLYFLVPNMALGGDEAKIRFAWAVFIFGFLFATSVHRARIVRLPLSLFLAPFLFVSLILCMRVNARLSRVVDMYASAMDSVPRGATFVRLRYPTPALRSKFGFTEAPLDPLYHMDAYVAASRHLIDLTDYQAASSVFPIVFRSIAKADQDMLWSLEAPGNTGAAALGALRDNLPMDVDFVVIVGGENTPEAKATDLARALSETGSDMRLISGGGPKDFLRVYRRISK